ncbi:YheC/YheD family protein [Virgibacillus halophilus]|uniref:YheC/YheD family protein n=1 Tax=Tigheibacillus halophilus TaxID=361280 RepID=A0ABU5C3U7_9BACI|nr:YheC/YheD family protein [Virgibacillus halophilus]
MSVDNKQLVQSHNLIKTLLEATEHFHNLVKEKEVNQSIFILTSIVEGFEAVSQFTKTIASVDLTKAITDVEEYLLMISRHFEKGNFIKINEIVQFAFMPKLKRIETIIRHELAPIKPNEIRSIGVFHSFYNPLDFYPEERVNAMVKESERQHARLLFFTSNDVNFDKEEIDAKVWVNGKWEHVKSPFPDVINNVGAGKRTQTDRKLRKLIPFTSFHVGNKYTLPKKMAEYRKYTDLLVPFLVCKNEKNVYDFLDKNNKVVFKYLLSNRGENIYFVTKKGSRYIISTHKKEKIMNHEAFNQWLQAVILREKGSFIMQRYIHTRTKQDEPYHFRAHVQKDGKGRWTLTHIYPRIGSKKSNLSNVVTDGRVEDFHDFLMNEYGESIGSTHETNILGLSLEIARHLDKLYGLALDELGIDLAIDDQGKYWMHEANNGPQTAYHEQKKSRKYNSLR